MSLSESWRRFTHRLSGRRVTAEDERLIALFQNRAELKKELKAIEDERARLLDRLKLQEGATLRVEEQLGALEQYMGRPEEAAKSVAYFQLRAVWRAASRRVEMFGAELARQQKDRERKQQLAEFQRTQRGRLDVVDRELVDAAVMHDQLSAEQKLAAERRAAMRGFWNYFRRRKQDEDIAERATRIEETSAAIATLNDRKREIEAEAPPEYPGLSVEGKRAVNLATIAVAESLYDRYSAGGVADLARQCTMQRVYDTHYGTHDQCQSLIQLASRAIGDLDRLHEDLQDIKIRTDRLRTGAVYRSETDTVPVIESINPPPASGSRRATSNVLLEEFWDLYKVLVR